MPLLSDATALYAGDLPAQKVYLGDTLVWSAGPPPPPPLRIPGLVFWLDATTTGFGPVAQWTDRSDSALVASQPDPAKQPISKLSPDGRTVLEFDRTKWMTIAGLGTVLEGLTEHHTIIVKVYPTAFDNYPILMTAPTGTIWNWLLELNSPIGWFWGSGGNQHYRRYDQVPTMNQWWTVSHVYGSSPRTFFNGAEATQWALGSNGDVLPPVGMGTDVRLGAYYDGSLGWPGQISDILVYDRALSDAERQEIEAYLGVGRAPFDPMTIPGLNFWVAANSLVLAEGADVWDWPDLSITGSGVIARQGQDNPPMFKPDAGNGLPAVRFARANNEFMFGSVARPVSHAFAVAKYGGTNFVSYDGLFTGGAELILTGDANLPSLYPAGNTPTYYYNGEDSTATRRGPMNEWAVLGISFATQWPSITPVIGSDRYNADRYWEGDVAEILTYNRVLTTVERQDVEQYLMTKWAI